MSSYNKVILMGNLTRDPELRYIPNGTAVAKIGMAVNRKFKNRNTDELEEEVTFVDVEAWGKQAETFSRYMTKGRPVFIEGRLRLDRWKDQDGNNRSKMLVVMENFQFVGGREGGGSARTGRPAEEGRPVEGGRSAEGAPVQAGHQTGGHQAGGHQGQAGGAGRVSEPHAPASSPAPSSGEQYDFDDIPF